MTLSSVDTLPPLGPFEPPEGPRGDDQPVHQPEIHEVSEDEEIDVEPVPESYEEGYNELRRLAFESEISEKKEKARRARREDRRSIEGCRSW